MESRQKNTSKDIIDKYGVDEEYDDDDNTPGVFDNNSDNNSEARAHVQRQEFFDDNGEDEETPTIGVFKAKTPKSENIKDPIKPPNYWRIIAVTALSVVAILCAVLIIKSIQDKRTDSPKGEKDKRGEIIVYTEPTASVATSTPAPNQTQSMGPFSPPCRLSFVNGGSIMIPEGFKDGNKTGDYQSGLDVNGYGYYFFNEDYGMEIFLSEAKLNSYINAGFGSTGSDVLKRKYNDFLAEENNPTWNELDEHHYRITGYSGDSVYYYYAVLSGDTVYTINFIYPKENKAKCDPVVENVEKSLKIQSQVASVAKPSAADLDAIGTNITYPVSENMYLDSYRYCKVQSSPGKEAVYAFINPNLGQTEGNYYTVYNDTEVTVLAERNGYSCGIIPSMNKAGWIRSTFLIPVS